MSLVYDKSVPSTVLPAALQALSSLSAVPDARGGQSPLSGLSLIHEPLPVYSLPLDGLGQNSVFKDAKPVSWRVFVVDGQDEPVGAAEVVVPPGGGLAALCLGYTQGRQVISSGRVLSDAEGPAVEGRYEPRFLEIPGLGATAVWLRNLEGNEDRIIPVDPVPRFLRMKAEYTPSEFLDHVRSAASKRLQFEDAPLSKAEKA